MRALIAFALPTVVLSVCRSPKYTSLCPDLMAAFSLTVAFDSVKDAECFNFCKGEFVDNNSFFFGTTECKGIFGGEPYVSGCTLDHLESSGRTSTGQSFSSTNTWGTNVDAVETEQPVVSATTTTTPTTTTDSPSWIWRTPSLESSGFFRMVDGVTTWLSGDDSWTGDSPDTNGDAAVSTPSGTVTPPRVTVFSSNSIPEPNAPEATAATSQTNPLTTASTVTLETSRTEAAQTASSTPPLAPLSSTEPVNIVTSVTSPTSMSTRQESGIVLGGSITSVRVSGSAGTTSASIANAGHPIRMAPTTTTTASASTSRTNRCTKGKCKGKKGKKGASRSQNYETLASGVSQPIHIMSAIATALFFSLVMTV